MKKNLLFRVLALFVGILFISTNLEVNGQIYYTNFTNDASWINGTGTSYSDRGYEESGWNFEFLSSIRDSDVTYDGSAYSARNRGNLTVTGLAAVTEMTGFKFYLRDWRNSPKVVRAIMLSTNGGASWTEIGEIGENDIPSDDFGPLEHIFEGGAQSFAAGDLKIRIIGDATNNSRIRVGGFEALGVATAADPPSFFPAGGNYYEPIEVSITTTTVDATVLFSLEGNEGPWTIFSTPIDVSENTTIWAYAEKTGLDDSPVVSATYNFPGPATTTLPYAETFDTDLGDCHVYSVSGATKFWEWRISDENGYAMMNGYNSGEIEEDWLILPGLNLDDYNSEMLEFDTWYNFGTDDDNNYLKLMYSTDYQGIGDPSGANWTELGFTKPSAEQAWTSSGLIDLSAISGTSVWIAFKYRYEPENYRAWQIDNISIFEATSPMLVANPLALSNFNYIVGEGPSEAKSFELSGNNLDGSDVTITAPASFEVYDAEGGAYANVVTLTSYDGSATHIWVQLAGGLSVATYNGNVEITGGGAEGKTVAVSGEVIVPPPPAISIDSAEFTYTQDFNTLENDGFNIPWSDGDIEGWMWQCAAWERDPNNIGYRASDGESNAAEGHSFGSMDSSDRAIGAISGGSNRNFFIGVKFMNETSQPIALSDILVSYAGEQWRQTTNAQAWVFSHMISGSNQADIKVGTWTALPALDFEALHTSEAGPLDGNLPANRTLFTNVPLAASKGGAVQPGEYLFLRWFKTGTTSPGLGIDDFVLRVPKENTSVDEINEPEYKIFPNPTIGDITVAGKVNIQRIRVTNMLGQQVLEVDNVGSDRVVLQTADLRTGYYIISITDVDGYTVNNRFMKR